MRRYVNHNGQVVARPTGKPGMDQMQHVYLLRCMRPGYGNEHGANGADIWLRKFLQRQSGVPGLSYCAVRGRILESIEWRR